MNRKSIAALVITALLVCAPFGFTKSIQAADDTPHWTLEVQSCMDSTDSNTEFITGDYNGDSIQDVYAIKKNGESGKTEIRIINGKDNYQSYLLETATVLNNTDYNWDFKLADYNNDGKLDLYAIYRNGASGKTEVHILNGADNYQSYLLSTTVNIGHTSDRTRYDFEVGDYNKDNIPDLYMINKKGADGKTEVHVFDGKDNFQTFLLQTTTTLHQTNGSWDFKLSNYNDDDKLDILAINRKGKNNTEIHVLNGADNFQSFTNQLETPLEKSDSNVEFSVNRDSKNRAPLFVIKRNGANNKTEIHKMSLTNEQEEKRQAVVDEALYWEGKIPYYLDSVISTQKLDKNIPPAYMDCADFVSSVYYTVLDVKIGTWTGDQKNAGVEVDKSLALKGDFSNLKKGDIIIFNFENPNNPDGEHVGMYIGDGKFIHESGTNANSGNVKISNLDNNFYGQNIMTIRRIINE